MDHLLYVRLIGFTFGTLLQLFWIVVILGHRRQRNFERVLFFFCLGLFFYYSGSLLALNAQIHYSTPPAALQAFAVTLLSLGLCFLPPLLVHLHLEYAATRNLVRGVTGKRLLLLAMYAPAAYFALTAYPVLVAGRGFDFLTPGNSFGRGYGYWFAGAMALSAGLEFRLGQATANRAERSFHRLLGVLVSGAAGLVFYLHVVGGPANPAQAGLWSTVLALLAIPPMAALIYLVQRFNFLQIGRQKNLLYAVSATFLALLYLSLVRRGRGGLGPVLPPEATASILLFVLVIFVEPLQRVLGGRLRESVHQEMDRLQRLTAEIQQEARQGDLERLRRFVEKRVKEAFELAEVRLELARPGEEDKRGNGAQEEELARAVLPFSQKDFELGSGEGMLGTLHAEPHGASLSGETRGALEFLCEQLPGALDLCRLIEEKLRLERELAERERLALVGQMAASISHNLKNPLGSIKTILQVQLEGTELPESLRGETTLVLEEISRLSAKLNQLLQFSRPAVRPGGAAAGCDARSVTEEVLSGLRHEAERRGIQLRTLLAGEGLAVGASRDAVGDVVSNLVVNALEATPGGGNVSVALVRENDEAVLRVEDDGPGIPAAAKAKILQPFFTTKAQGTGLGLAIVARRVAESNGRLAWVSPAANGHGTRFEVRLPLAGSSLKQLLEQEAGKQ